MSRPGSRDFEVHFILAIIHKQRFRDYVIGANIQSEIFNEFDCRYIYEKILWLKQRDKFITFFSVYETIRRDPKLSDDKAEKICKFLKPFADINYDVSKLESVVDGVVPIVEDLVKARLAEMAIIKSSDLFEAEKHDEIISLWRKVGQQAVYRVPNNVSIWEAIKRGGNIKEMIGYRDGIETGIYGKDRNDDIDWIDHHFFFKGVGKGQLCILLGESGLGKTTFCLNMAIYQSLLGYNVDYRSLEVDKEYLVARSISMLTDIPTDDIIDESQQTLVEDRLAEIEKNYPNKKDIKIYHDNPNALTVGQIGQDLMLSQQEGRKVDSLFVDYLDLMKSERSYKEKHYEIGQNAIDLRGLADEFDCASFSPSQFQRAVFKDKKKHRGREGIQGAFSKVYTCDILIDINSEMIEETDYMEQSYEVEYIKVFVDKNRFGRTGAQLTLKPNKMTGRFFNPLPPEESR